MRAVHVLLAVSFVFVVLGVVMHFYPRRDRIRPFELSGLHPPFNPWGNGVRKVFA